jgi:hypothetical protein
VHFRNFWLDGTLLEALELVATLVLDVAVQRLVER